MNKLTDKQVKEDIDINAIDIDNMDISSYPSETIEAVQMLRKQYDDGKYWGFLVLS